MTASALQAQPQAIIAFDRLAKSYDDVFTRSVIGRKQRNAVWAVLRRTFRSGDHILELNCGTGEDALFLARHAVSVHACDASEEMVRVARKRHETEAPGAAVRFEVLATEKLGNLTDDSLFDGVFSNFSGLNCVADLAAVAEQLSIRVKPGAPLLLCLSTRICLWEILWFVTRGKFHKAFRRWSGKASPRFGELNVAVYYPMLRRLRQNFAPRFVLRSVTGIGIALPPSYMEAWARKSPRVLNALGRLDGILCNWPGFRAVGDHMLLRFEKVQS